MFNYIKKHKSETFFVSVITLFALILRLVALYNFGDLWVDELYSFYFANQNDPIEISKILYNEDFHVPLYFVLLHYWMKIFGQSDFILRLFGCLITTCSIPAIFYVCKNLFNGQTAYFSALFFTISAFNMHYSAEVRFYGSAIFLSILSTYFFVKLTQCIVSKFYAFLYILSTLLFLYTYNFAFMFVFCEFLVGIFYLIKNNKSHLRDLLKVFWFIFILYLPVIFYIFHSFTTYRNALLSFFRDIFSFDLMFFYNFFLASYSNVFDQWMNNNVMQNDEILRNFFAPFVAIFMTLPIILGLVGIVKALISKNKSLILFFAPSVFLFLIQIIFVFGGILALNLRYTIIPVTIFTVVSMYGWSLFKNKKLSIVIFSLWLLINFGSLFCVNNSAINRKIVYSGNLQEVLDKELNKNDCIFIPRFSKLIKKYVHNGKIYDFDTYDAFLLGIRPQDVEFIFGKNLAQKLNRKMLKTYLYGYITSDVPSLALNEHLRNEYFSKLNQGQRFVIITDETSYINDLDEIQKFITPIDVYRRSAIYYPLSAKITYDIINSAMKELKFVKSININSYFSILIFEKSAQQ